MIRAFSLSMSVTGPELIPQMFWTAVLMIKIRMRHRTLTSPATACLQIYRPAVSGE